MLNLAELVVNELMNSISKHGDKILISMLQTNLPIFFFLSDISLLNVKISRAYNETTTFTNPLRYSLSLIMNYQSSKFGVRGVEMKKYERV